jgi:type IV pilus assembly protein PilA
MNNIKNKKRKGFTLIELIIVLAIMVIIAAIAIPNFSAVRDNAKNKADVQSCETIKRTIMMLVADGTVVKPSSGLKAFTVTSGGADGNFTFSGISSPETTKIIEALKEVKVPQGRTKDSYASGAITIGDADTAEANATKFAVTIDNSENIVVKTVK